MTMPQGFEKLKFHANIRTIYLIACSKVFKQSWKNENWNTSKKAGREAEGKKTLTTK